MALTRIYNERITDKRIALTKLAQWYESVERLNCKFFNSVIATMQNNYATIVNYFDKRSTNASAESLTQKLRRSERSSGESETFPFLA